VPVDGCPSTTHILYPTAPLVQLQLKDVDGRYRLRIHIPGAKDHSYKLDCIQRLYSHPIFPSLCTFSMDPRRPTVPEYTVEVFADQTFVKEVVKGTV